MYFLKCILCDTPNVTYAMQECMGKIKFMAKRSTTPTYFLTIYSNTDRVIQVWQTNRRTDRQTDRRTTVTYVLFCDGQTLMAKFMGREQTGGKRSRNSVNTFRCKLCENNDWWRYVCGRERKRLAVRSGAEHYIQSEKRQLASGPE